MSYLLVSVLKKKELKAYPKGRLDPKKREKKKKGEGGIFLVSRDKYEGRGGFLCFLPQTPTASHAQRKRKRRGGEEGERGGGGGGD